MVDHWIETVKNGTQSVATLWKCEIKSGKYDSKQKILKQHYYQTNGVWFFLFSHLTELHKMQQTRDLDMSIWQLKARTSNKLVMSLTYKSKEMG